MSRIVVDARRIRESTGRYVLELLNQLQQLDDDNEYHVVIHTADQGKWTPTAKNFVLHVVPYDHYTFGEQLGFARFLYSLKPDLVHFAMPQQPLLYFGKRITTVHDLTLVRFQNLDKNKLIYTIEQTIFKFLLKNVAKRSKKVITPTKFVKKDIVDFAKLDPGKVVVTLESYASLSKTKPVPIKTLKGKEIISYVGNAFPHKNLGHLIEAFLALQSKHPKLHLALAGKKEFFYEQLEKDYSHVKNLHFLGFIPDEQMVWLMQNSKAYVFPSLSEGFGLPGLDAMQYGLPLVSSKATCLPEVYGDAAHYFDPTSIEDTSRAIDEVLRSKERQNQLVKNGQKQLEKFSWKTMAIKTHTAYVTILTD